MLVHQRVCYVYVTHIVYHLRAYIVRNIYSSLHISCKHDWKYIPHTISISAFCKTYQQTYATSLVDVWVESTVKARSCWDISQVKWKLKHAWASQLHHGSCTPPWLLPSQHMFKLLYHWESPFLTETQQTTSKPFFWKLEVNPYLIYIYRYIYIDVVYDQDTAGDTQYSSIFYVYLGFLAAAHYPLKPQLMWAAWPRHRCKARSHSEPWMAVL